MSYKNYFSSQARIYAKARPDYPEDLPEWLATRCARRELAWDCATGNGQAARSLSSWFERVVASDASAAQIEQASGPDNIEFAVFPAEAPVLASASVDLVTVAQALHWFAGAAFFTAVDTVLRPGGLLACWCYGLCEIDAGIDREIERFYHDVLGPYWPPERRLVENRYRDITFPYTRLETPAFTMRKSWRPAQLLAYLESWSATQRYINAKGHSPVPELAANLRPHWPDEAIKTVLWPLTLVACQK